MSKPFVSEDVDSISCPSSWQSNRSSVENASQTDELQFSEASAQSTTANSVEVQTQSLGADNPPNVDISRLAAWLNRITPRVLEELDKCQKSRAFDDYKLQNIENSSVKLLFSLSLEKDHPQYKFITSSIDWSCTGGVLAVSRCAKEHSSWCDHSGSVCLYQTNRPESKPNSSIRTLDVSSCVTRVCAHPSDSFILACGTFSGEVTVWNLQRDDAIVIGNLTLHNEAIVHLQWVQNFDLTSVRPALASVSRDGMVIIWTAKSTAGTLKATQGFLLQSERDYLNLGILCASFNPSEPRMFLCGIEGGSLALCRTDSRQPLLGKKRSVNTELEYYNPILNIIESHKGTITGVRWVPGSKDLFVSCGTDHELNVYSLTVMNVIRKIHLSEPLCGLDISSSHPDIAVIWSSSGNVHLCSISSSKSLPTLEIYEGTVRVPLSAVCVRTASAQLLALGDSEGKVCVWEIPHSKFSNPWES
ncbi:Cytoplasmic dynein 2 intermediate chain 2 [Frankliniella fusca]|uniref:Cytoplasmic dynein 2 intermediate chain 2 n=1 Tax=Frankliniella fusca TaxID=407009 RepID=A0AAE1LTX1_9NEOP|nr:Cytoplasmic dynein 2 intermediate chain 2 [Frankliniella fusca]